MSWKPLQVGKGEEAVGGRECTMSYKGTLKEGGATFDQANKFKFCLGAGEVIKGWEVKKGAFEVPTVVLPLIERGEY